MERRRYALRLTCLVVVTVTLGADLFAQPLGGKWTEVEQLPMLTNARMVFADSLVGYYIGSDTGYVTKNGGVSWTQMKFPDDARPAPTFLFAPDQNTIISFQRFSTDSNGIPFPGIIKSTNMGVTWTLVAKTPIPATVNALTMWNANDGFRIWLDDIYKRDSCALTHDGGKTFTDIRGDATLEKYISELTGGAGKGKLSIQSSWSDSLHGAIAVSGSLATAAYPVLITSDGGRSWSEHYLKYKGDSTIKFSYIYTYPATGSIWVVPSDPKLADFYYYSPDYGNTWTISDTLKTGYISKLAPVSPTAAWAFIVGSLNFVSGSSNVLGYKDLSAKWNYIDTLKASSGFNGPAYTIQDIQFKDARHGWTRAEIGQVVNHAPVITDSMYFFRYSAPAFSGVIVEEDIFQLHTMPNPASSAVVIEGFAENEKILGVKFTGIQGNEYSSPVKNLGQKVELDVSRQPNGYYIATIMTSQRTKSVPVIVLHH